MSAKIRETLSKYFAAIRRMDVDSYAATFSEDCMNYDPPGNPPLEGREAVHTFLTGFLAQFTDFGLHEENDAFVVGDQAAVRWTARGTLQADGRQIFFEGIDVFTFNEDGQITELRPYWDPAAFMAQLPAQ